MQAEATALEYQPGTARLVARLLPAARFTNRILAPFGLAAVMVATMMIIGLHLLPGFGGVNPITGMLSDYGVRPDGWIFDTALDILSLGSVAVLVKMAWHGVLRGRTTQVLMASWCVCLVGISAFTKDPNLGTQTFRGSLHLYSTAVACGSLPAASLALGWRHRRDHEWRRFAWTTQGLALVSVPCVLPFLISFFVIRMSHTAGVSVVPTGLVERVMGLVDLAIMVVLALWAHRASTRRRQLAVERTG